MNIENLSVLLGDFSYFARKVRYIVADHKGFSIYELSLSYNIYKKLLSFIRQFKEYYTEKIVAKLTDSPFNMKTCHGIPSLFIFVSKLYLDFKNV